MAPPRPPKPPTPPRQDRAALPPVQRLREVGGEFTRDPEVVRRMVEVLRALMRHK